MSAQQNNQPLKETRAQNGLGVKVPQNIFIEQRFGRIYIFRRPPNEVNRDDEKMYIEFIPEQPLPTETGNAKVWHSGNRTVYYIYKTEEAGSSIDKVVEAWEQAANGYIFYRYEAEEDGGSPFGYGSYALCWQVIEGTSFVPPNAQ